MQNQAGSRTGVFISTKEHRRFIEFADSVRKHRYIGLCHGPAGVGKTLSARRYARWDKAEALITGWGPRHPSDHVIYAALARSRSVFYTPTVKITLQEIRKTLPQLISRTDSSIHEHVGPDTVIQDPHRENHVQLVIIDEAERLNDTVLEYLRDLYDRSGIGLILIGMPGIDKRLARYPQLYSRIGFAHAYQPLKADELTFVLNRRWKQLGLELDEADFTDTTAMAAIIRITGGNFRLLQRIFVQIDRILRINELSAVSEEVVEAAHSVLVIGDT